MPRRLWLSLGMLVAGVSLLVVAGLASPAQSGTNAQVKNGGTYKLATTTDLDSIDPQIAYGTLSWWIEWSTGVRLLSYPDAAAPRGTRLFPEGAKAFPKISHGGRTYTFTIRPGFKFSNGAKVTAKNYAYAINRALNKDLNSPAAQFIDGDLGVPIVGAKAVNSGQAQTASGVKTNGNRLIIQLEKPDPTFLARISLIFFQATSLNLPIDKEIITVHNKDDLPTAGPYYVSFREPNRTIIIKKNPNYKKGAGRTRPRHLNEVDINVGVSEEAGYRQVLANQVDEGPIPAPEVANVRNQFGVNKSRFWVKPRVCVSYLALNTSPGHLFAGNVPLRKAVNYAIRRQAMVDQGGVLAGQPWDHVLPPGMPGANLNTHVYPLKTPNLAKAKKLAKGHTKNGKAVYYFFNNSVSAVGRKEINRADLANIGITMEEKGFRGFALYTAAGKKGSDHDITQAGWCQDYPDPSDFVNILLFGGSIQPDNNNNLAYFNSAKYNAKMNAAAKKVGKARLSTYGKLDLDIIKNQAPWASFQVPTNRYLFSNRVNSKCLIYQGVLQDFNITNLCLK